jgi:hypothetical protein
MMLMSVVAELMLLSQSNPQYAGVMDNIITIDYQAVDRLVSSLPVEADQDEPLDARDAADVNINVDKPAAVDAVEVPIQQPANDVVDDSVREFIMTDLRADSDEDDDDDDVGDKLPANHDAVDDSPDMDVDQFDKNLIASEENKDFYVSIHAKDEKPSVEPIADSYTVTISVASCLSELRTNTRFSGSLNPQTFKGNVCWSFFSGDGEEPFFHYLDPMNTYVYSMTEDEKTAVYVTIEPDWGRTVHRDLSDN